jgi:transcriptional regulator GlxA family with amidase domain
MSARLSLIKNWPELAPKANWAVSALAKQCRVSVRALEHHFLRKMGTNPKNWLREQRQQKALEMLSKGASVKEIAFELGYKHSHHLSRDFKAHFGYSPTKTIE